MDFKIRSTLTRRTPTHPQSYAASIGWRRPPASIAFSLGFACATPFAAFAAAASLIMNRRDAMLLVALVWLANQGVGFGVGG
jgi:hypothetical protein